MNSYYVATSSKIFFFPVSLALTGCILLMVVSSCREPASGKNAHEGLASIMEDVGYLPGKEEYKASPYVAAGNRMYMIGHQDGTFPDIGWHTEGEMGGIWDHPVKLIDGFAVSIIAADKRYCLEKAEQFINYPFANQLDYRIEDIGLQVNRFQFVPDELEGLVIEFLIQNQSPDLQELTFEFSVQTDLRPVWLGERTGMVDTADTLVWNEKIDAFVAQDKGNPWYAVWGSTLRSIAHEGEAADCLPASKGNGVRGSTQYNLVLKPGHAVVVPIAVAGSYHSSDEALATFYELKKERIPLLQRKKERYDSIEQRARITIPDKDLQQAYTWVKYNTDWLIREVPGQGRGLSAGLPDYPWWFGCDNTYALKGLLCTGRFDEVFSTIELLSALSGKENGNGRIVHEVSTNGAVFNPGNVNETPQFVSLIWATYQWTGDHGFLEKYFPLAERGLEWLIAENDENRNLLPDGFGMMEIHGMDSEMIDVAVYTQKAFHDASQMARVLELDSLADHYKQIAATLKNKINRDFWVAESNSFADFIGTPGQAKRLIDQAIVRADSLNKPWAVEELVSSRDRIGNSTSSGAKGYVVHHNWVVNTPMEMGIADTARALLALETARRFINPFGMFVTGIDRDETAGTDPGAFGKSQKVFSYVGAVMTLPTGVQAIAENNYGRPDRALEYLQMLTRSFGYALPGSMYEVSPDFGMMAQAWNLYALAVPLVQQFFGVQPNAGEKLVLIHPAMPDSWDQASIENLPVGDQEISIYYLNTPESLKLIIRQTDPEWKIVLRYPENTFRRWIVNGARETPEPRKGVQELLIGGQELIIELVHQ